MTLWEWKGLVLVAAVGIDLLFGEPGNRFHPVAWMGWMIGWIKNTCSSNHWFGLLLGGFVITAIGVASGAALGTLIESMLPDSLSENTNAMFLASGLVVNAFALKTCFGIRALEQAADTVYQALLAGDLGEARRCLAFHLVSRDVQHLNASQISAAAIESVAENTSDSVVAPLFFFLVAGVPGAMVYRYVNTCDAMLGYRTANLNWLGKVPARTDDLLNLVPARMTVALMMLSSSFTPHRIAKAVRVWWADSGKTPSPNAGHPMSAAAGLLAVRLQKKGQYDLGNNLPATSVHDIAVMRSLFRRTVFTTVVLAVAACLLSGRLSS